jgi:2-dehydropantoate 2-reductase
MKIAIIGTGAMGSLFAARLSGSADVFMLGSWREQISAISKNGLLLIHPDGLESRHIFSATTSVEEVGKAEVVLILVKGWQTECAAQKATRILTSEGLALTLQNGLGNLETVAAAVGAARVALGVTSEGATMIRPGTVRHAGAGQTFLAATERTSLRLTKVMALFQAAGFESALVHDPQALLWAKLAVNAAINPLTALLRVPNGFLVEHAATRSLMSRAAEEAAAVAEAQGISLPYASASGRAIEVARATAANWSSMAQDVARGTPTEIDSICGAIIRYGDEWGVSTPVNQALLHLINSQIKFGDWETQLELLSPELRSSFMKLATLEGGE